MQRNAEGMRRLPRRTRGKGRVIKPNSRGYDEPPVDKMLRRNTLAIQRKG